MKILAVDTDHQLLDHLVSTFSPRGFSVHCARETLEAIDCLEKHQDFNLMICDFILEDASVAPLFWHLSVNDYSLPSIIYSSAGCEEVRNQINYPDIITIVAKPNLTKLTECVQAYAQMLSINS